jgi:hypothetical protein
MRVVGIDAQATPGQTLPSNEVSSTVGASSSISISYNGGINGQSYTGFRLYFGTAGAGSETCYVALPAGSYTATFTSTSGQVCSVSVPTYPSAYLSWLFWDSNAQFNGSGCIYCAGNGGSGSGGINSWQLGVGDPAPASGTKFSVKGGSLNAPAYTTTPNCASTGGTCTSAAAGSVTVAAGATSVNVATTAVTANSEIFVQFDSSLGTRLGVTCNTTVALPAVTARTAATSFVLTIPAAPVTNPACFSYYLVN